MPGKGLDPYAVLGISPTATPNEIKRAYRNQVRAHHPDTRTTAEPLPSADEDLRQLITAYTLLRDPERRARYDRATTRDQRPTKRGPTAARTPRETTNTANSAGSVRIPGLTITFRVTWLSQ